MENEKKEVLIINIAEEGKPAHNIWMMKDEHDLMEKWMACKEEILSIEMIYRIRLTTEQEKVIYEKHGVPWAEPTSVLTGRYIMTDLGIMWEDKGKVYKISQAPDSAPYQPETEEYTGEYKITRGISSFDF